MKAKSYLRRARVAAGQLIPPTAKTRIKYLTRWPRPRWGNLRRAAPFSPYYGADRGTPIDRVYIDAFLTDHAEAVRGLVLEVKDDAYTRRLGGERVTAAEVVDIDAGNAQATVVADLGVEGSLPEARYDCFLLTQTAQLVPDVVAALRNAWATIRPGGTVLLTVPAVSRFVPSINDLWRFTPAGLEVLLARVLPEADVTVRGYGNLLSAVAFLHGLAAQELSGKELAPYDLHNPVLVGARIDKPGETHGMAR